MCVPATCHLLTLQKLSRTGIGLAATISTSAPLLYLPWLSCGTYHKPTFLLSKSHTEGPEGLLSPITAIFVLPTLVQEEPQGVWDHTSADGHTTLGKVPMHVLARLGNLHRDGHVSALHPEPMS